tara:strand:+ start:362 stop:1060 length:699 start_codon:yes stop_codon:yes gene_type:complete
MTSQSGLCIIPARGGSKRFPRKNLAELAGRSLVQRALDAATKSNIFSKIILSSDDQEILSQASSYKNKVTPLIRDKRLSSDHATALELVNEITDKYSEGHDFVALLLPTAPLRTEKHLVEGYKKLLDNKEADGIVSLTTFEFPPQLSVKIEDDFITPIFEPCPLIEGNTRSQDQFSIFRPNGAFYMHRLPAFYHHKNFWKGKIIGYLMDRSISADIDTEFDLKVAELLLENA